MKIKPISFFIITVLLISSCSQKVEKVTEDVAYISPAKTADVIQKLKDKYANHESKRIERCVEQVSNFWFKEDGTDQDFESFCLENYTISNDEREQVFQKISRNYEVLKGNLHRIDLELKEPLHLVGDPIHKVDLMFGGYNPYANLNKDFFGNKIAHYIILNFPFYTLEEKEKNSPKWNRKDWAYARIGDLFTARIPAELELKSSEIMTNADIYISEYNIQMDILIDSSGKKPFPKGMSLITHWGLRDELKSNYADKETGIKKQDMIYNVMKRIIDQSIPINVINSGQYQWNPEINKLYGKGKEIQFDSEPNTRYNYLLENFHARKALDEFNPGYPTFIQRAFDRDMELSQAEVETLFIELCSSPEVKKVAELIKKRLGRELKPYDIWYDGFKSRSNISGEELDKIVKNKYPSINAFQSDLENMLKQLGFSQAKAEFISNKIQVDAARGSGHAWGAEMKSDIAHLRTRIPKKGMNYKGYNIAIHEFGHNVEQTISLQNVDYYMLHGVPNTAFTEALAFIFQKRDLDLLGIKNDNPDKLDYMALDNFWSTYEIMGVSLVDMNVWKWMYANPEATPEQLKEAVISIAKDIWNKYYAQVFGSNDEPILAIYSHMIDNPLYLSAYPIGHLIDFQIEEYINEKEFAHEIERIYRQGRIIPQVWMQNAVNQKISNQPILKATRKALTKIKE